MKHRGFDKTSFDNGKFIFIFLPFKYIQWGNQVYVHCKNIFFVGFECINCTLLPFISILCRRIYNLRQDIMAQVTFGFIMFRCLISVAPLTSVLMPPLLGITCIVLFYILFLRLHNVVWTMICLLQFLVVSLKVKMITKRVGTLFDLVPLLTFLYEFVGIPRCTHI